MGAKIYDNFVKRGGPMSLSCFSDGDRSEIRAPLDASSLPMAEARKVFDDAQKKAVKAIEDHCYTGALLTRHLPFGHATQKHLLAMPLYTPYHARGHPSPC